MGTLTRSDRGVSREEIESIFEQKIAKFEEHFKEDKEFKRKLVLQLSQMRQSQEISQEAFDRLNALVTDFIEGDDKADLDSF